MAPAVSPLRDKALKAWLKSGKTRKLADIAEWLGVSAGQVRKWKHECNWDAEPLKKPRGAPIGNQNAVGNSGGSGAPPENDFAVTHGLFRKYLPAELADMAEEFEDKDPIDMLWDFIVIQYANIMRSQKIMYVTDKNEMIKELKKQKFEIHNTSDTEETKLEQMLTEEEHEFQFSWDRQSTLLKSQAIAIRELRGSIRQFLAAAPEDDERRIKLATMQLQANKLSTEIDIMKNENKDPTKKAPNELTEAELDAEIARMSANEPRNKAKTL